ncbi:hypothetical protein ABKN59_009066 [Abortiporus biennis]
MIVFLCGRCMKLASIYTIRHDSPYYQQTTKTRKSLINPLDSLYFRMSHAPVHCTTEFDHELITFLSEHYENGVFHAKGHAEPPRTPDVAAYAAAGGNMIDVGFGPLRIIGNIQGLGISGEVGVNVPILGYKKLINISGDLVKGVEAGFDVFGVASGSVRVFLQGKNVMVNIVVKV